MNIFEFSIGDIIHRVSPGGWKKEDRSYMGSPVKLLHLEKGVIFLEFMSESWGSKTVSLPEFDWQDGWDYYPIEAAIKFGIVKEPIVKEPNETVNS